MTRSFQNLRAIDPGFEAESRLAFNIGLPARTYATRAAAVAAHHAILDRLSQLPGVRAVSATTLLPFGEGSWGNTLRIEGLPTPPGTIAPVVQFRAVAGGYVEALGMRLVRGRGITRGDVERGDAVVVVNQALARGYFRETDPIGRRIQSATSSPTPWLTIIGVTADTPTNALAEASRQPTLYMPMSMAGGPDIPAAALLGPDVSVMSYLIHATTSPLNLLSDVRGALDTVDDTLAIAQPRTLQSVLDRAAAQAAFTMVLGIYGVISYVVTQRTGEIGLRLAMGADPSGVALMILRQSGLVALVGVATGLVIALAGGRLISTLLYGVSPRDPAVFAATTTLLLAISTLASWLPARRAARLSPLDALRAE
jgi:predicted permease